jgi:SsrA-binding protein
MAKNVNIKNRRASYEYEYERMYTAGIQLMGSEVKSIRDSRVNISDAYCYFDGDEMFVKNMSVQNIEGAQPHDTERTKKLLLHRDELNRIQAMLTKGKTVVVTKIFETKGKIKLEIAVAVGKKNYDKRMTIKERDLDREANRSL